MTTCSCAAAGGAVQQGLLCVAASPPCLPFAITPGTSDLPWLLYLQSACKCPHFNTSFHARLLIASFALSPDDGYQQIAFEYVWRTGGLASEVDYPYIGVSSYCNASKPLTKFNKVCRHRWRGHIWTHGRDVMQIHD